MDEPIELPTLVCLRCTWHWHPKNPRKPRVCPHCKSPYWDRERRHPKLTVSGTLKTDANEITLNVTRGE